MLCGVTGGTGWLMTAMTLISHNFLKLGLIILLPFYILAIAGAVIAVKAMKEEK